jgi:hypothetical protein
MRSIKTSLDDPIRVTPIYIDIYSQCHLDNYLQRRQNKLPLKSLSTKNQSIPSTNGTIKKEPVPPVHKIDLPPKLEPLIPTLPSPTTNEQTGL